MAMAGLRLAGDEPFREVVIHGLVRDRSGRKMSKSTGNVIDPLDMIDRYGADSLRFALARMAGPEQQNLPLTEESIEAARHFANKIWNAARLVLSQEPGRELPAADRLTLTDRWLLSRHEACRAEVDEALEAYRLDDAAQAVHRFLWSEYCDWGLELAKHRLYEGNDEERDAAGRVVAWILERTLRLLHPVMPFITEEIWQRLDAGEWIVTAVWPEPLSEHRDPESEQRFSFVQDLVAAVRRFRSQHGLPPGVALTLRVAASDAHRKVLADFAEELRRLARLDTVEASEQPFDPSGCARLLVQGAEVLVPLAGILDVEAECRRLRSSVQDLEAKAGKVRAKLDNREFVQKAPAHIVEKQRRKLEALDEERAGMEAQLTELGCA
jgi:valyl-tRNA synthetase